MSFRRRFCFLVCLVGAPGIAEQAAVTPASGALKSTYQERIEKGSASAIEGKVLRMDQFRPDETGELGVALKVATEAGDVTVHLGPRWFVMQNDLTFTRGEPVSIVGIKIRLDDKPVVVATEVAKEDKKVILREPSTGKPKWLESGQ